MQSQEGRAELVKLATPLLTKVGAPTLGVMLRRRVAELAQIDLNELDRLTGRTPRFGKKANPRGGARGPRHDPSLVRRLIRWLALNPALAAQVQLDIDPAECGPELQALLALALLIQSEATPPSPAQLEERLRDTELGERLRPLLVQAWQDGEDLDLMVRVTSKDRAVELWKQYYSGYAESYPAIDWIGKVPAGFGEGAINWGDIIGEEEENG
jgi:DNA primase